MPDTPDNPVTELRSRIRVSDLMLLFAVPAAMVYVFSLPDPVRAGLVFSHADPTIPTAYSTHFVHRLPDHLTTNLVVYGAVVVTTYALSLLADRRSDFLVSFVVFLGVFPFVLTGLEVLFVDRGVLFGFSGVGMAFVGFLPIAVFAYLGARVDERIHLDQSPSFFFFGVAVISLRTAPQAAISKMIAAGGVLLGVLYLLSLGRGLWRGGIDYRVLLRPGSLELVGSGVVVFFASIALAFPANPVAGDVIVDLYAHLLGYSLGFVSSYTTIRIMDHLEPPSVPSPDDR